MHTDGSDTNYQTRLQLNLDPYWQHSNTANPIDELLLCNKHEQDPDNSSTESLPSAVFHCNALISFTIVHLQPKHSGISFAQYPLLLALCSTMTPNTNTGVWLTMSAEQNASFYTTENSQQLRKIQTSHAKAYKNKPNKNKQAANSITVFIISLSALLHCSKKTKKYVHRWDWHRDIDSSSVTSQSVPHRWKLKLSHSSKIHDFLALSLGF